MRKSIVAGNWKMHKTYPETKKFLDELVPMLPSSDKVEVIVAPSFTNLQCATTLLEGKQVKVSAQNMHQAEGGAFTGEISAQMLTSVGVKTVILGHSERRIYFHETSADLRAKVDTALRHGMKVIFCIGEELKHREAKQHFNVIFAQLTDGLFHLSASEFENIIVAYEPVWAIGTGQTATNEQAQEMHKFIREEIERKYDKKVAQATRILYGGSVKASNAKEIFAQPDVDGGLVGGAALIAEDFAKIVEAAI
ncbi:triose-phosphate isomerase [Myroides sp. LJL116]